MYLCSKKLVPYKEYCCFDHSNFPAHSVFTFDVCWGSLGTSIFWNSSSAASNTRSRLPSRLSFRFLWLWFEENIFIMCVLSQYTKYKINFQNMYTLIIKKSSLHTLSLLVFKIVENLKYILENNFVIEHLRWKFWRRRESNFNIWKRFFISCIKFTKKNPNKLYFDFCTRNVKRK